MDVPANGGVCWVAVAAGGAGARGAPHAREAHRVRPAGVAGAAGGGEGAGVQEPEGAVGGADGERAAVPALVHARHGGARAGGDGGEHPPRFRGRRGLWVPEEQLAARGGGHSLPPAVAEHRDTAGPAGAGGEGT
jgi:hypothetical protein